ncbi:helix-turn-helix domain-containing protein [Streptomyces sp. NA04227]|uniref:helix-turn-helix domain-containing protein n=1 Tax=Streptomyces sp. NA04227 TaxID=2742136 RepID=UPI00159286A9|nr:helix-turn-helix domain-containing protein [Streptomyces sp. NA04227]QKW09776.1 helix-turn-helix domain-containing protein [Streptomyces sp. NA04227]
MTVTSENMPDSAADHGESPPPELLIAGRYAQLPGYAVHRAQGARSWLLLWTEGGAGRIRQGAAEVRTEEGELVALAPGVRQDYRVAPDADCWHFWWVHCRARPAWEAWLRPHARGDGCFAVGPVPTAARPRIGAELRRLHADARWTGEGAPPLPVAAHRRAAPAVAASLPRAHELAMNGVERVLLLTTSSGYSGGAPEAGGGADSRVRRVEALIAADPAAPHTVASLAEAVRLSPSRLAHLFTEQTGRTPMRALREARLQHAARLLETTALDVGHVAAASGFASPFHFSRAFRTRFGVPPRQYRG